MASSNRHWPSMFKSKPCNAHHQWQHDINPSLLSSCQRSPYTSGSEERTPEPKPRWNPKPEQISILEAIFNSGMVNPPRDEIKKIRAQLQEFGQVGDANVFYWFQNRKSRSKHKQRHLHNNKSSQTQSTAVASTTTTITTALAAPSSSSSSSEKTSPENINKTMAMTTGVNVVDALMLNSPTASVNQPFYQTSHGQYSTEPFCFPVPQHGTASSASAMFSQGLCFPELSNFGQIPDPSLGNCSGVFLSELLNQEPSKRDEQEKTKLEQHLSYTTSSNTTTTDIPTISTTTTGTSVAANVGVIGSSSTNSGLIYINHIQDLVEPAAATKSTVIVNDMPYEVCAEPFNVQGAFGDDVVLVNACSLQTVPMNEWGVTLQSLQPGVLYYPMRTLDYLTT